MESSSEETPSLPEQVIMEEILPRLPVKSLLKFRCVSKPWCSLIGSKRFIKAHFKYSIQSSWIANKCFYIDSLEKKFKQFSLASMFNKEVAHPISPFADLGIKDSTLEYVSLVGCCNGLVCILIKYKRFILWNPTTKKFKNLPHFNNGMRYGMIMKYGFGYDELSDDYKVFGETGNDDAIGKVYSLRSNSWKDIEKGDVSRVGEVGMYASGKLHWRDKTGDIVSFDLNTYTYGVGELPIYIKRDYYSLGVLGGCLSLHFVHSNGELDVWVMKEYGVKDSWDKMVTVPFYDDPNYRETPTPFAVAPNGEVLLVYDSTMEVYNPNSGWFRYPHIIGLDDSLACIYIMGIYIESLASVES